MKKIMAIIVMVLSSGFFSCKKSYACVCSTSVTFPGRPSYETTNTQPLTQKHTKKQAAAICKASEAELTEHFQQQLKDPSINVVSSSACVLK